MSIKFLSKFFIVLFLFGSVFAQENDANASPIINNEKFTIQTLQTINSAQATFRATTTTGNYASFEQLKDENLISDALATGEIYGYHFSITITEASPKRLAGYQVTAVPLRYQRTGLRSFFIDETAFIRGADKRGAPANVGDPFVTVNCGESGAISLMRIFSGAEATYHSANNNFGTLLQLIKFGVIYEPLADGENCGYLYTVAVTPQTKNIPAGFQVKATPQQYGVSGVRSFYIDETGIIRGGDKGGAAANSNDPPIE